MEKRNEGTKTEKVLVLVPTRECNMRCVKQMKYRNFSSQTTNWDQIPQSTQLVLPCVDELDDVPISGAINVPPPIPFTYTVLY